MEYCGGLTEEEFFALPLEARLRIAASDLMGWRYSRNNSVPHSREGIPDVVPVDPDGLGGIDCCTMTSYLLMTCLRGNWAGIWALLQVVDAAEPWSPIRGVEQAGVGSRISGPVEGVIALSQAWKDATTLDGDGLDSGHARLVKFLRIDGEWWCRVWESTSRYNNRGPTISLVKWQDLLDRYQTDEKAMALGEAGIRLVALGPG